MLFRSEQQTHTEASVNLVTQEMQLAPPGLEVPQVLIPCVILQCQVVLPLLVPHSSLGGQPIVYTTDL